MEVKPGYKMTEVGVIPEDWEVKPLGECLFSSPNYGINAAAVSFSDQLPVYLRITDISEAGRFAPTEFVSVCHRDAARYFLSDGDLVFARTGASVGKSYLYRPADGPLVFAGFLIRVRPNPEKLVPKFLIAFVHTNFYWIWIRMMSMRSGQPGVNGQEYSRLPIPIPPLREQTAIATALSDVDALIESLEQLITKTRAIKQGAMQELLTGKRRLPGFGKGKGYKKTEVGVIPEDWDVAPLSELIGILESGISVNSLDEGEVSLANDLWVLKTSCVSGGRFVASEKKKIHPRDVGRAKCSPSADSIIVSRMNTPALVGECGYVSKEYSELFLPDRLWIARSKGSPKSCFRWLAYVLSFDSIARSIKETATGTSGSMKNISKDSFFSLLAFCPSLPEQTAIAAALSDMDTEIESLEAKLTKTRQIKQGMMSELLTGRIRLI